MGAVDDSRGCLLQIQDDEHVLLGKGLLVCVVQMKPLCY
jgi:hypothetical protein